MSSAVIYYEDTAKIVKRYKSLAAAKAALTRAWNSGKMTVSTSFGKGLIREKDIERLAVATTDYFNERVDYKVEVKVLLGEKDANGNLPTVMINRSDVGSCVDPSTERYWSM